MYSDCVRSDISYDSTSQLCQLASTSSASRQSCVYKNTIFLVTKNEKLDNSLVW